MRILINFATLKKGGGQNVGLNFINGLNINKYPEIEFFFAACKDTQIEKSLIEKGYHNIISLPPSPVKRIFKEKTFVSKYIKQKHIDVVYTCFGYSFINKSICQICGVADSNLLFPEIDFWEGYTGIKKLKKHLIDSYRKYGYKRANGLIFENAAMQLKSKEIFGKNCNSVFIKPSFSLPRPSDNEKISLPTATGLKCLFLCGWQRNKGILKIPEIISEAQKRNIVLDSYISVDVDEKNSLCSEFLKKAKGMMDHIHLIGSVKKTQINYLYNNIDYVFLLSKLESFSNNIIEAWFYKKPLIVSDEDWSRAICNKAALYVDRNDANAIVDSLVKTIQNGSFSELVNNGVKEFETYPTIDEKIDEELKYVQKIWKMVQV